MSDEPTQQLPIPVTLLTGFLGSGKTTLLNHLVRQPEFRDALVIINEFGEMSLDHLLVAHSTENLVVEMGNGCLCCTIRDDLVQTLKNILWRFSRNGERQFNRVLIETTGLADPAPIVHTLVSHPQIAGHYRLDGIVSTLDLATAEASLDHHQEAVKQAAMADVLLLTKVDMVSAEQRQALLTRLDAINPSAPRWDVVNGQIDACRLLDLGVFSADGKIADVAGWLQEEAYLDPAPYQFSLGTMGLPTVQADATHHDVNRHDDHIRAFCMATEQPLCEGRLAVWLNLLMSAAGPRLLRVKGILNIAGDDRPRVIHAVQHVFHPQVSLPAWPDEDHRSRLVFITQDIERETIEKFFRGFNHLPQHEVHA